MSIITDKFKKDKKEKKSPAITQKNIEESREEILANGKKFRYPFQYAKHRLVINTIAIAVVALVAFLAVGWLQVYKVQSTSDVVYRFVNFLRLPVAEIDGHKVRYSDYLMIFRSSIATIEYQSGKFDDSEDSKSQINHYKRQAMDAAEDYTYALAKMEELGLEVTNEEIDAVIEEHKTINGERRSDEVFETIVKENFGFSMKDYRRFIMLSLAKRKVAEAVDTDAKDLIAEVKTKLAANQGDMATLATEYANSNIFSYEKTDAMVSVNNLDGGRAAKAYELEKAGDISDVFISKNGDGFYIVKLVAKSDNKVNYESIWVRFSRLNSNLQQVRDDGKVKEYIKIEESESDADDVNLEENAEPEAVEAPEAPTGE